MTMSQATLLQAVDEVARLTGQVALRHYRTGVSVETKGDGSPVTIADRAAEEAARAWITARFPGDAILGEEFGAEGNQGDRRWIIDPIDGTKTFVRGVPLWGTLIGVTRGEEVLAGAIYCPAVEEMVAAALGEGCWWNGTRSRVSDCRALSSATVLVTADQFPGKPARAAGWTSLAASAAVARTWGDCYGYVLVATGRAELMVDNLMSPWDSAALVPVVREAGGEFSDWNGRVTAFGDGAVATNAALASELRARLGVPWPGAEQIKEAARA
ncbi:MAG TPA: histidinol-phosphatase [Gemmatimonadaceae bacterium]|nr:histidinol-phosphatase [Gemmatimonadaceae bacterium]